MFRRIASLLVGLALLLALASPLAALDRRKLILLLTTCPQSVRVGTICPLVSVNFASNTYWVQGQGYVPSSSLFSITRVQTVPSYATALSGLLVPFVANTLRITDQGLLIEEARTNDALWSRDLTNAAWTAVTMTAAHTATGADGTANAATLLTATAGNATILQSITLTSQADTSSVYLRCVTCTGNIQITENNGTAWTTCAGLVTTGFVRCSVTATLANPVIGIRIVNSGDSVVADFFQMEPGGFVTSPIPTTNANVSRNADAITPIGPLAAIVEATVGSAFVQTVGVQSNAATILEQDSGSDRNRPVRFTSSTQAGITANGTSTGAVIGNSGTAAGKVTIVTGWDATGDYVVANNGMLVTSTNVMQGGSTPRLGFAAGVYMDGTIVSLVLWKTKLPILTAQSLSNFFFNAVAWGDSLTAGNEDGSGITYPNVLGTLWFPQQLVLNNGVGGYASTQILALFQANPQLWGYPSFIWSGNNNHTDTATVESDVLTQVGLLTTPKYIVLSVINGEFPDEYKGQTGYNDIAAINTSFSSSYGNNYLDVRTRLVNSYNPSNGADVVDFGNDVPPFTLRAIDISGTLVGSIGSTDTSFTTSAAVEDGNILTIGSEYILITAASGTSVTNCTRGYGSTVAASHSSGASYVGTDPIHLSATGYALIAQWVYEKERALGW